MKNTFERLYWAEKIYKTRILKRLELSLILEIKLINKHICSKIYKYLGQEIVFATSSYITLQLCEPIRTHTFRFITLVHLANQRCKYIYSYRCRHFTIRLYNNLKNNSHMTQTAQVFFSFFSLWHNTWVSPMTHRCQRLDTKVHFNKHLEKTWGNEELNIFLKKSSKSVTIYFMFGQKIIILKEMHENNDSSVIL